MKPKGTRLQSNVGKTLDEDPMLARELLDLEAEMHDLEPVVYSPTFVEQAIRGREDPAELHERVREAFEGLAAGRERMFLEGGGQYNVGGIVDLTDADLAELLDARVLVVARTNALWTSTMFLPQPTRSATDSRASSSTTSPTQHTIVSRRTSPLPRGRDVPVLGVLPSERTLSGVTVADLADELGASMLVEEPTHTSNGSLSARWVPTARSNTSAGRKTSPSSPAATEPKSTRRRSRRQGSLSDPDRRSSAVGSSCRPGHREGRPDPLGADRHADDRRTRRRRRPKRPHARRGDGRSDGSTVGRPRDGRRDSRNGVVAVCRRFTPDSTTSPRVRTRRSKPRVAETPPARSYPPPGVVRRSVPFVTQSTPHSVAPCPELPVTRSVTYPTILPCDCHV